MSLLLQYDSLFLEAEKRTGVLDRLQNGRVYIKIIQPGQGSTGFYTAEVLDETARAGLFDEVPIYRNHEGTGQHKDHSDIDLVVGYIDAGTSEYLHNGPRGEGVYATATILEPHRRRVYSLVDTPFGMSIHADGELTRAFDVTSPVKRIDKVHSVDLVVKPGAGGAIVEVLESERLERIGTLNSYPLEPHYLAQQMLEQVEYEEMPRYLDRFIEQDTGAELVFLNNIYEDEDDLEEDEFEELGAASRAVGRGMKNSWQMARSGGKGRVSAATGAVKTGAVVANKQARMAGQAAGQHMRRNAARYAIGAGGIAAGGGAMAMNSRRRKEEDFSEEGYPIVEDDNGNQYAVVGNIYEDELEEIGGTAARAVGRGMKNSWQMARSGGKGRVSAATGAVKTGAVVANKQARMAGQAAGQHMRRNAARYAIGAGGIAAGGGAMAMNSRRRKEDAEEDFIEDDNGNVFQFVGNIHEDFSEMSHGRRGGRRMESDDEIIEALASMQEQLNEIHYGPAMRQEIAESARNSTWGSKNARHVIQEAAIEFAATPREAQQLAMMMGQAILADRDDYGRMVGNSGWGNTSGIRGGAEADGLFGQQRQEGVGVGQHAAGGGNGNLREAVNGNPGGPGDVLAQVDDMVLNSFR